MRLNKKLFWSTAVFNIASSGQGQKIKIKKHFLNTLTFANNNPQRSEVTYTRRREGIITFHADFNDPSTVVSAVLREGKSTIEIGTAPRETNPVRF